MATLTLCLDIGGTKIAAGLADPGGALVHTAIRPTPAGAVAEEVWDAVAATIADALRVADGAVTAVGIASAGPSTCAAEESARSTSGLGAASRCETGLRPSSWGAGRARTAGRRRRVYGAG